MDNKQTLVVVTLGQTTNLDSPRWTRKHGRRRPSYRPNNLGWLPHLRSQLRAQPAGVVLRQEYDRLYRRLSRRHPRPDKPARLRPLLHHILRRWRAVLGRQLRHEAQPLLPQGERTAPVWDTRQLLQLHPLLDIVLFARSHLQVILRPPSPERACSATGRLTSTHRPTHARQTPALFFGSPASSSRLIGEAVKTERHRLAVMAREERTGSGRAESRKVWEERLSRTRLD
ncbi:uncharacterized protein RHTO_06897 [Rhodotorula toruloides NP11]|uniref:Uncharacterized protein n=1 Tax=Rhodotorula toruloides (strain NP11) TaxID=1130832 RepID=M7XUC7_RHOT1|nr:uncharacterized protein RHTO_06897 [Rhodotorula toruloides NP11]EMS23838.1 hypothetical protein RHTO_06897 [Rhodotorula toruloides NP11]